MALWSPWIAGELRQGVRVLHDSTQGGVTVGEHCPPQASPAWWELWLLMASWEWEGKGCLTYIFNEHPLRRTSLLPTDAPSLPEGAVAGPSLKPSVKWQRWR